MAIRKEKERKKKVTSADDDVENLEPSHSAGGDVRGEATMENSSLKN